MIELFSWNPKKKIRLFGIFPLPIYRHTNNFGDIIGPLLVNWILDKNQLLNNSHSDNTLFTVGSVIHFAKNNNIVWGSGINAKINVSAYNFKCIDCRSVRGPLTRRFLKDNFSISTPEIYGDPALLLPLIFKKELFILQNKKIPLLIPNLNDYNLFRENNTFAIRIARPTLPLEKILKLIINSSVVFTSSLHAFILAEAYNIPCYLLKSQSEPEFKYLDYYYGTGRSALQIYENIQHASRFSPVMNLNLSYNHILDAFPFDLFPKKPIIS